MSRCACVTCRGRYDYADLRVCGDCGEAHLCPICGESNYHAVVFLDEPVVIVPKHQAAMVRASVWGRPQ